LNFVKGLEIRKKVKYVYININLKIERTKKNTFMKKFDEKHKIEILSNIS